MGVDHIGGNAGMRQEIQKLWRELRRVSRATLQNSSIGRAGLRVYDGGWIRIEDGGLSVTGTATVSGTLTGSGTFDWTGPVNLKGAQSVTGPTTFTGQMTVNGPWDLNGNGDITGNVGISGDVTIDSDLTLGAGRIVAGSIIIDKNGGYGGRVYSSGSLLIDAASNVLIGSGTTVSGTLHSIGNLSTNANISALGDITAVGDIYGNSKNFLIDHPVKPGKQLRHGSLEGPEHGVYYRGVVTFDGDGKAVFELPAYFTALVLPDDVPTVQVTASGRPFMTGAEPIADGRVTVYGEANREAHVTVTAARGLFEVEPEKD